MKNLPRYPSVTAPVMIGIEGQTRNLVSSDKE